jgi:hypothetical protein
VVAIELPTSGQDFASAFAAKLTSAPAPSCVSPFAPPIPTSGPSGSTGGGGAGQSMQNG